MNNWLRNRLNYNLLKYVCISMNVFITVLIVSFMSCESNRKEQTLWVNSAKVDCGGVGKMQCLQVKNNKDEPWSNLNQEISGFDFEPGYIYRLRIIINTLDETTLPEDKSNQEYHLVEVISKETDPYLALNDIWIVTEIQGALSDGNAPSPMPSLEINTRTMEILGSDGCNQYNGKINNLSGNDIRFGPVRSTRKACPDMTIADAYNHAMGQVSSYHKEALELVFYDSGNSKLLTFKKVD